ncbi:MAG TPA: DNRLRE domain-containing protein, partial [Verrucomicrobiae bacterium]
AFHPVGAQGVTQGGGYLCEVENIPSSTTSNAGVLVDFDYYIDVMTGRTPQMARFENWSPAVPTSSSASWTYTPTNEPAMFTGLWQGKRWGARNQQGVGGSHCMAIDLENHNASDHTLTTPPVVLQPGDLLFFSASSKMSVDAGSNATPANGFAYAVSVQVSPDQTNWTTVFTCDQNTVTGYNWSYQTLTVPLQETGTRWIRWLLPAASVSFPTNVQFYFVSIDNVRVAQRLPGNGEGINVTRRIGYFADGVIATASPLTFDIAQGKGIDDHRANLKRRHIAFIDCINNKVGSWAGHPFNAANGGPITNSAELYSNPAGKEIYKRCLDYIVARWGAYVDVWEHFNEVYPTDNGLSPAWFDEISAYLSSIDPYQHPICTTYDQPTQAWSDLSAPHWYPGGADTAFAATTAGFCNAAYGKPIIIDEFGNSGTDPALGNNTPVRFRTAIWSSFFVAGGLCFWDDQRLAFTNGPSPWGGNNNTFYGPELRRYTACFNRFIAKQLATILAPHPGTLNDTTNLETWGVASHEAKTYLFYVHNKLDHAATNSGKTISFSVASNAYQVEWYSPNLGSNIVVSNYTGSAPTLTMPAFTTDLALRLTTGPDTNPPTVLAARASSQTSVTVDFNEPVSAYDLARLANFALDGGAQILGATPAMDGRSVTLLTSLLQPARTYQLTVTNVADLQAPPNRLTSATLPVSFGGTNAATLESVSFRDASISINDASVAGKGNNGGLNTMLVSYSGRDRALVWFPVPASTTNRPVSRATLRLYCSSLATATQSLNAYRLTHDWTEGTSTWGGGWADGVSWRAWTVDYVSAGVYTEHAWTNGGGDLDATLVGSAVVSNKFSFVDLDITGAVNSWANGTLPNYGLLIQSPANPSFAGANFYTRNHYAEPWKGPRVVIEHDSVITFPEVTLASGPQLLPNGTAQTPFTGTPGWNYSILATTNLSGPWLPLINLIADPLGNFVLQDPEAPMLPRRFYKVAVP